MWICECVMTGLVIMGSPCKSLQVIAAWSVYYKSMSCFTCNAYGENQLQIIYDHEIRILKIRPAYFWQNAEFYGVRVRNVTLNRSDTEECLQTVLCDYCWLNWSCNCQIVMVSLWVVQALATSLKQSYQKLRYCDLYFTVTLMTSIILRA